MTTCAITIGYNNLPPGRQSGAFKDSVARTLNSIVIDAKPHTIYCDGETVGSWRGEPERGHFWLVDVDPRRITIPQDPALRPRLVVRAGCDRAHHPRRCQPRHVTHRGRLNKWKPPTASGTHCAPTSALAPHHTPSSVAHPSASAAPTSTLSTLTRGRREKNEHEHRTIPRGHHAVDCYSYPHTRLQEKQQMRMTDIAAEQQQAWRESKGLENGKERRVTAETVDERCPDYPDCWLCGPWVWA